MDLGTLRIKKINRTTYAVNGIFTEKLRFDDEIKIKIEGYNLQGGEYRKLGERSFEKPCTSFKESFGPPYADFLTYTNLTICPVDPVYL
jgi:hypothetical protein